MIGKQLGHYQVTAHLGTGGMGEVYRATDTKLGRDVALKLLPAAVTRDAERVARFEREARTLASLQHPNIASIYGFENDGEHRFLAMELVEGHDVSERIAQGPLPLDEALNIARQITLGLEAAHAKGIVHRDLKPANIKLMQDGQIKILDFGLARAYADEPDPNDLDHSPTITAGMTQAGVILGTAAYMSPEQARGKPVDPRTDIWAFGCVLYEMLVGQQTYPGETVSDVIAKILERQPDLEQLPASTPPSVRRLLRRCLSKDPNTRLRDIADARLELDEIDAEATPAAAIPVASARRWGWIPWALVAALAIALGWSLRPTMTPEPVVTRFTIDPPAGASMGEFTLSPDGRMLAFVATQKLDEMQLWIRRFDADEPELLPGTEGASFPFWAPDNRAIGFFSGGKLRRIDLATKTTQTLADAPNGRGSDWSTDDTILFTPEGLDVLYAVPATGGEVTAITALPTNEEEAAREASHRFPHFLEGSRVFTYLVQDPYGGAMASRSFLTSLDAPADRTLLVPALSEVYAPPGYLLFVREGTLIAQPFDADRVEMIGEAHPLATGISSGYPRTGRTSFTVSDAGVLAYRSMEAPRTELAWYDRAGNRLETIAPAETYVGPALSPDGRRLVFGRTGAGSEESDLWMLDLDRGTSSRVATGRPFSPSWSSDGQSVSYVMNGAIHRQRVDRTDAAETVLARPEGDPEEVPNVIMEAATGGDLLILANWDSSTDWDLWLLRPGPNARPEVFVKADGEQFSPAISPDGRWVAYSSNESGRPDIFVQNVDDQGQKRVVSTQGGLSPSWNEDGSELYYLSPELDLMVVEVSTEPRFTASTPERLFGAPAGAADSFGSLTASPDLVSGRTDRFLFNVAVDAAGSQQITVVLNWAAELPQN